MEYFRAFFQIAVTHSWGNSNSLENLFSVSVVWSPFPFHQACRQAWWGTAIMHILSVWIVKVQHSHAAKIFLFGGINLGFLSTKVAVLALAVTIVVFSIQYSIISVLLCWWKNNFSLSIQYSLSFIWESAWISKNKITSKYNFNVLQ